MFLSNRSDMRGSERVTKVMGATTNHSDYPKQIIHF